MIKKILFVLLAVWAIVSVPLIIRNKPSYPYNNTDSNLFESEITQDSCEIDTEEWSTYESENYSVSYPSQSEIASSEGKIKITSPDRYIIELENFENVNLSDFDNWETRTYKMERLAGQCGSHKTIVSSIQSGSNEYMNDYIVIGSEYPRAIDDEGKNISLVKAITVSGISDSKEVEAIIKSIKIKN